MKLAISNIAWQQEDDEEMLQWMKEHGFEGVEIAPTRIIPQQPYEKVEQVRLWYLEIQGKYGFEIPSMQSIWYGRTEKIFGSEAERIALIEYTKKAILFAQAINCKNLVFGCPKNRFMDDLAMKPIGIEFFREIGEYAAAHDTTIGLEANPVIYNTNYINTTESAMELIREVNSAGFKLNLDVGTMLYNEETIDILKGNEALINHVHISEPYLKEIEKREVHKELLSLLKEVNYTGYISIEMGNSCGVTSVKEAGKYLCGLREKLE